MYMKTGKRCQNLLLSTVEPRDNVIVYFKAKKKCVKNEKKYEKNSKNSKNCPITPHFTFQNRTKAIYLWLKNDPALVFHSFMYVSPLHTNWPPGSSVTSIWGFQPGTRGFQPGLWNLQPGLRGFWGLHLDIRGLFQGLRGLRLGLRDLQTSFQLWNTSSQALCASRMKGFFSPANLACSQASI